MCVPSNGAVKILDIDAMAISTLVANYDHSTFGGTDDNTTARSRNINAAMSFTPTCADTAGDAKAHYGPEVVAFFESDALAFDARVS